MERADYTTNFLSSTEQHPHFKPYNIKNFRQIPQIQKLSEDLRFEIEVVGHVLPFKTNNYVIENLIDWSKAPDDPMFALTFPRREMLWSHHFEKMANILKMGAEREKIKETANQIRMELNPHPAGQMQFNVPILDGVRLAGMQHKYRETILFFPRQGQSCFAYCTFCFRWPQFVGITDLRFASRETELLVKYIYQHPEITDILFTGGDPLIMKAKVLAPYIKASLISDLPNLQTIRIGTKALSYWPYRFLTDPDAEELLGLFRAVTHAGKHLAIMAHFNHPRELQHEAVEKAIQHIRETGAEIRTQAPLLAHINDQPELWTEMWKKQVHLGCVPYYMFVARDTGAQHYFGILLVRTWEIFRDAYKSLSGLAKTVRGPVMSTFYGKVQILGVTQIQGEKVFTLIFLEGRDPEWVLRPFFARYNEKAIWFDDLDPAFGEKDYSLSLNSESI